ncbi:MAG: NAD(+) synthase [Candidatus Hodarchaeota archaeon]
MNSPRNFAAIEKKITHWLQEYLLKSGSKGFVVALSGGVDSSVTAVLCRRVTKSTLALLLPCGYSSPDDISDAILVVKNFDIDHRTYDLTPIFETFLSAFHLTPDVPITIPLANIKARLRMVALYYESNRLQRLVVGTSNRTELALGFFTKYGDGGVDLMPLGNLLKREIRGLASHLGIPQSIIMKTPSPGLWPGQTDEGELGASYDQLDDLVMGKTTHGMTRAEVKRFQERIAKNVHKRNLLPICPL